MIHLQLRTTYQLQRTGSYQTKNNTHFKQNECTSCNFKYIGACESGQTLTQRDMGVATNQTYIRRKQYLEVDCIIIYNYKHIRDNGAHEIDFQI